jgi:lipid II:glycine glycyltransferase (peptidoglycan interpeptide bridge formation enzyme)
MNVRIDIEAPSDWDDWLGRASDEASIGQSTYWARVNRRLGARPYFISVFEGSERVAGLLALAKRDALPALKTLEWMDGPVLRADTVNSARATLETLLDTVEVTAKKAGAWRMIGHGMAHGSRWASDDAISSAARTKGYELQEWATLLVDLTPDEDVLFRNVDHSVRKAVNKCRREGVRVTEAVTLDEYLGRFVAGYGAMETAFGRKAIDPALARAAFEEDVDRRYRYFVAESGEGEPLAALGMYKFNETATEIASSLSPLAMERKLPAQDFLHWEVILAAKRAGCRIFDMAGMNPHPTIEKEKGIRRFKEKFGGRQVNFVRLVKRRRTLTSLVYSIVSRTRGRIAERQR